MPKICACSKPNSINHVVSCAKGGFTDMRYNQIWDIEAKLMEEVCKVVRIEPRLSPLTGETFRLRSTNTQPDWTYQQGAYGTTWRKPYSMSGCSVTATSPTVAPPILCFRSTSRRRRGCTTIASYRSRNILSHNSYSQQAGQWERKQLYCTRY